MGEIALLGGSFNPIHNGHLAIAENAYRHFSLNKVLFIPTADHPFKKKSLTLAGSKRKKIIDIAIKDTPYFECWDGELNRSGVSYTVDSIKEIREELNPTKIYWIIGADNLSSFNKWYKYNEILENATLAVTERPNYILEIPNYFSKEQVVTFPSPLVDLSSTDVRNCAKNRHIPNEFMPRNAIDYIYKNNIYV